MSIDMFNCGQDELLKLIDRLGRTKPNVLAVAKGEKVCAACHEQAGPHCLCHLAKNWWRAFSFTTPIHDQHALLLTLQPSEMSRLPLEVQREVIDTMQANPLSSYGFFGPAGCGKTTFSTGLYEAALWNSPVNCEPVRRTTHVWRVSAKLLMDQNVAYATGKEIEGKVAQEPYVNRRKIVAAKQKGLTPRLFLEEIDKVQYTPFKADCLWELLDAIYANEGQLVFDSNLTQSEFLKQFNTKGSNINEATIGRRISENVVHRYNFFRYF